MAEVNVTPGGMGWSDLVGGSLITVATIAGGTLAGRWLIDRFIDEDDDDDDDDDEDEIEDLEEAIKEQAKTLIQHGAVIQVLKEKTTTIEGRLDKLESLGTETNKAINELKGLILSMQPKPESEVSQLTGAVKEFTRAIKRQNEEAA